MQSLSLPLNAARYLCNILVQYCLIKCAVVIPVFRLVCGSYLNFQFTFQPGADGESHIRVGKLNMVDLAGSERQTKTGATVSIVTTDR